MNEILKVLDHVGQVKIKSVTDTLFRYGVALLTLGTLATTKIVGSHIWVTVFLFVLGGFFLIFGLFFYAYFAKKNPDYLRSETYQLRKQSLELLGDKNHQYNPSNDVLTLITSPYENDGTKESSKELK